MIIKFVCFVGFVLGVLQVSAAWNPKPFPPEEKPYLNEFNNDYGCTNYDTITPGKSWQTSDGAWISTPEDKRCVQYCRHWKPEEQVKMICYCDTFYLGARTARKKVLGTGDTHEAAQFQAKFLCHNQTRQDQDSLVRSVTLKCPLKHKACFNVYYSDEGVPETINAVFDPTKVDPAWYFDW